MRRFILFLLICLGCWGPLTVFAQTEEPTPTVPATDLIPLVHTVQDGENLTIIATNYNVTVAEILLVNNLTDGDVLAVGQQLVIPGGAGEAVATVHTVQAGETLPQVAAQYNTTIAEVLQANSIINREYQPAAGETLSIISRTGSAMPQPVTGIPHLVKRGESLLTIAAQYGISPAALAAENKLAYPYYLFPGQRLRVPGDLPYYDLPGEWKVVQVGPTPIQQGNTVAIYVENLLDGQPSGSFAGQPLRFYAYEEGHMALAGIDAFTEPGSVTLQLSGSGSQPWQPFQQRLSIIPTAYNIQQIVVSEELSALLDPVIRQEEDAFLATIYNQSGETQAWEGLFQFPVTSTVVTAPYGDGRSYNGGPVEIFHTGIDFSGGTGTPILAPARGTVVFAEALDLRGNTVILDHGLGVMTAYFHLSEIEVALAEEVEQGQKIGAGGSTGLSTGPHLHWDVRVNNVAVNGRQWTEQIFP